MKVKQKNLLKLKSVKISKLNSLTLTGKGGVSKTFTKSVKDACLSYLADEDICKI